MRAATVISRLRIPTVYRGPAPTLSGAQILLVVALAALVQLPFGLGAAFGEQDAARLANDAYLWVKGDIRNAVLSEYRYYVSPGYIVLLAALIPLAELSGIPLPSILNVLNALAFVAIAVPLVRLFARLAGPDAAILGAIYLLFIPTFWQSGVYGFPHLLALLALVTALWMYDRWLTGEHTLSRRSDLWLIGGLLTLSVLLKGDLYLSAVAFPLLHLLRGSRAGLLSLGALLTLPVLISAMVSGVLLYGQENLAEYMVGWRTQYPAEVSAVLSRSWVVRLLRRLRFALGYLTVPLFVLGVVAALLRGRHRLAFFLALWVPLPLLFWALRAGDSTRHHLPVAVPLALGVGLLLASLPVRNAVRFALLALLLAVNYFIHPPSSSTLWPGGRIFANAGLLRERVQTYHRLSAEFAAAPGAERVILGGGLLPYPEAAVLARADAGVMLDRSRTTLRTRIFRHSEAGIPRTTGFVRTDPAELEAVAESYRAQGFRVYTFEYDCQGNPGVQFDLGRGTMYTAFPDALIELSAAGCAAFPAAPPAR